MYRIAIYGICKNEEHNLETFYNSCKDADFICLTDTGSTDNTVNKAKSLGITTYQNSIIPWRFDTARNISLANVPLDIDICIALDIDEVLVPNWRNIIEATWKKEATMMTYLYEETSQGISFIHRKVHDRKKCLWIYPIHEELRVDSRFESKEVHTDNTLIKHLNKDIHKDRTSYDRLIDVFVKESPNCSRASFYHTRSLCLEKKYEEAIKEGKRYLTLYNPKVDDIEEKVHVYRLISRSYGLLGDWESCFYWGRVGTFEGSHLREPWIELAMAYIERGKLWEGLCNAKLGLQIESQRPHSSSSSICYRSLPYDLISYALWNLDFKQEAFKYIKMALEIDPEIIRLQENYAMMLKAMEVNSDTAKP